MATFQFTLQNVLKHTVHTTPQNIDKYVLQTAANVGCYCYIL